MGRAAVLGSMAREGVPGKIRVKVGKKKGVGEGNHLPGKVNILSHYQLRQGII